MPSLTFVRCPGSGTNVLGYRSGQKRSTCPACSQMVGIIGPDSCGFAHRIDHDRPVLHLRFHRFGNAFAATGHDHSLYVVSYYLAAWSAYFRTPAMDRDEEPLKVGRYGVSTPELACQEAEAHYASRYQLPDQKG